MKNTAELKRLLQGEAGAGVEPRKKGGADQWYNGSTSATGGCVPGFKK
ncbi:hypothetical protein FIC_01020 [Flavobacteriaceae bacterium 3519-10]|nr:hypothetical protein FIC_01020 [Flavobacteriaceae bacterium 3519-10]